MHGHRRCCITDVNLRSQCAALFRNGSAPCNIKVTVADGNLISHRHIRCTRMHEITIMHNGQEAVDAWPKSLIRLEKSLTHQKEKCIAWKGGIPLARCRSVSQSRGRTTFDWCRKSQNPNSGKPMRSPVLLMKLRSKSKFVQSG